MLRSFAWVLAVGPILAVGGCSDPVPTAVAVGLNLTLSQTGTCPIMPGFSANIGNPPPDSTNAAVGPGKRVYSGEGGLKASCGVSGGGTFKVNGSIQSPASHITFNVDGSVTNPTGQGTISLATPALEAAVSSPPTSPCTLTLVQTTSGPAVEPGRVWSRFDCPTLTGAAGGNPNLICAATGEFFFENCSK